MCDPGERHRLANHIEGLGDRHARRLVIVPDDHASVSQHLEPRPAVVNHVIVQVRTIDVHQVDTARERCIVEATAVDCVLYYPCLVRTPVYEACANQVWRNAVSDQLVVRQIQRMYDRTFRTGVREDLRSYSRSTYRTRIQSADGRSGRWWQEPCVLHTGVRRGGRCQCPS